ncbi:MAG: stage II sporulation protein M [Cytophagaceae bacterium]|nr:stage II sporulation protein M [Gemmatimonadaceae bacterium]
MSRCISPPVVFAWKAQYSPARLARGRAPDPTAQRIACVDYRQHLEVETPEHVLLDYEIAGLGSRALAAMIDTAILVATVIATGLLGMWLTARFESPLILAVIGLLDFAFIWGYFTLFEGLREGQTPGKRWLGIRVIQETGHGITLREAAIRNLLRVADFLPPPYLIGTLAVAIHPRGKRLGDLAAGTVVVRDNPVEAGVRVVAPDEAPDVIGAPLLTDQEFQVLRQFAARAPQLDLGVRSRLTANLVARFADRVPARHLDDASFLDDLLKGETARRRGRFAVRSAMSPGASKGMSTPATGTVERLVAHKDQRWREYERLAARATQHGLNSLGSAELPDFAARYREVASDLARVRTYRADPLVRSRLERAVAAGHNLLYRGQRRSLRDLWRFTLRGAPAAVSEAAPYVLVSFLAFAVPAVAGYAALRATPSLAEDTLPGVMLDRAANARAEKRAGRGYASATADARPFVASSIIANNVQVAFVCFAGGIFLAAGSIVALAFNGLQIGAISGHYQNVGLLGYLWTFVAGHGVLELFAIWCAGAAGLLIGTALVRPGEYSRADALVIRGRLALRLVAVATILLLVAGVIEGFLSTSSAPVQVKVGVSLVSALLLAAWLYVGARGAPTSEVRDQ